MAAFLLPQPLPPLVPSTGFRRYHGISRTFSPRPLGSIEDITSHALTLKCTATQDVRASRRSLSQVQIPPFSETLLTKTEENSPLARRSPTTLQVNIGLTCNQACRHCHVESSPSRAETMPSAVASRLLQLASNQPSLQTADITGGAPELHAEFRNLVTGFSSLGLSVIDRCNLTILQHPSQIDLIPFLVRHQVHIVASLPCYSQSNVERQRGSGVFWDSISALRSLNSAGYGIPDSGLQLDLVYNPIGPTLPPPQESLQTAYHDELAANFGIYFNNLLTITNMPIKRFVDDLLQKGCLDEYMHLLVNSFNPETVNNLMCRDMIHVAWDGSLHDCDFNYALDLPMAASSRTSESGAHLSVFNIESFDELQHYPIVTGKHCYGCTAGSGSSCGGALT